MKWLVTGSEGFIGRHLCLRLHDMGHDVVHYDLTLNLDVREKNCVFWASDGCDVAVHLAAISGLAQYAADIERGIMTNILGAAHVGSLPMKTLFASSGAVYGGGCCDETASLEPANAYGDSKVAGERFCDVALRFANVYGPLSWGKTSVVHAFARQKVAGGPLRLFGDGTQVRDFVHVDDVVRAIVMAAQGSARGAFNVSSGQGTSLLELADLFRCRTHHLPARRGDVEASVLGNRKIRNTFGWRPLVTLEQGVDDIVHWYKKEGVL